MTVPYETGFPARLQMLLACTGENSVSALLLLPCAPMCVMTGLMRIDRVPLVIQAASDGNAGIPSTHVISEGLG